MLTEADRARMRTAADKRRAKAERVTNTPQARKQRAGTEWFAEEWGIAYEWFPLLSPPERWE